MSESPPGSTAALPRISIVVPSLNQGAYLEQALQSLFAQAYPSLEIVVMDGGSTDGSRNVIKTFEERLSRWRSEPDGGQAAAINEGIAHTRGDLVGWLNADDLLLPGALLRVAHAWTRHPAGGLYIGNGFRQCEPRGERIAFTKRHLALDREALAKGIDYVLQPATFFAREAWDEVGGLRTELKYCLDWDVVLRIAARQPAVLLNEFLAVSREHDETKTKRGGWERVREIFALARDHTGEDVTVGSLHYFFETLIENIDDPRWNDIERPLRFAFGSVHADLGRLAGNADGFPEKGDLQDSVDLPFVDATWPWPQVSGDEILPSISVVVPSLNHAPFLARSIESLLSQKYPNLETVVMDGGSTDGSAEILGSYGARLGKVIVEKDRGPAHAINKGFALASGDILGWLSSDDMLAHGTLVEVGRAFAADPDLDLVYGNAMYVDVNDQVTLANHGSHKTGLYFGEMQPMERVPRYWEYVHSVPQPTVFFRRRLLEACGPLDETYQYIFDFELFARMGARAKALKIARTLAFYRLHAAGKTADWRRFLIELYRFSRPRWPSRFSRAFAIWGSSYVRDFVRTRSGGPTRHPKRWPLVILAALSAFSGIGNPESWWRDAGSARTSKR